MGLYHDQADFRRPGGGYSPVFAGGRQDIRRHVSAAADLEAGEARNFLESLDYQQGKIALKDGFAELQVPEGYYYLNPEHAERVLTEARGSPPDAEPPLGMIFPIDLTPIHDGCWMVIVNWDPIGYVSDADASEIDYSELLTATQADTRAASDWRQEDGYESIELVGWAGPPHYDAENRRRIGPRS